MLKSWQILFLEISLLVMPTYALAEIQNENHIAVNGTNFILNYTITGDNKIKRMDLNSERGYLSISINATSDGNLTITLPRELIDAKINGKDVPIPFYYMGDYTAYDTSEKNNSPTYRTIIVPFKQGSWMIRLSGTQAIPEFGLMLSVVLPSSVIGMILVHLHFRTRFKN